MLGRLVRTHHTFPYFIHGVRALCACVFCFPQLYERISGSCDRAHAYVSARDLHPRLPPRAPYALAPALTITHALAPRAMLLYNVCESLAHKAPIRHNGCSSIQ